MPTKVACFLDTNILLYAALGKVDEPEKFAIGRDLVAAWDFGLSTQVLGEFFVNAQRKSRRPLQPAEAAAWVEELEDRPCAVVDNAIVRAAIQSSQRFKIDYWDAAILAAAERLGCPILYTEDLNHGQTYGSVRVVNPFRPA
jgi:predicted nucleic acid-binding protein